MKKFVPMTNREYVKKHHKNYDMDAVISAFCPTDYLLENEHIDCMQFNDAKDGCQKCWNLPAKINGKYIMKEVK